MKSFETLALRRLQKLVNEETEEARAKYQNDLSDHDPSVAVVVLVEEIGKVARSVNKAGMAADDSVAQQWRDEQKQTHRYVNQHLAADVFGGAEECRLGRCKPPARTAGCTAGMIARSPNWAGAPVYKCLGCLSTHQK